MFSERKIGKVATFILMSSLTSVSDDFLISYLYFFAHFFSICHPEEHRDEGSDELLSVAKNTSTNSPLERGRGVLECIELCILRFAHDTPPAPL